MSSCEELSITCNEVVDDGVGALVCVHSSGYVPHHCTWGGVLRHCQHLVRQAAALRCTHIYKTLQIYSLTANLQHSSPQQHIFTKPQTHRWLKEDRFIVINVQQRHLQRLCGLVRHWLAHVTGHNDKLKELFVLS